MNDSGIYACMTTKDQCQSWSNVTLIVTGSLRLHTLVCSLFDSFIEVFFQNVLDNKQAVIPRNKIAGYC